MPPDAEKLSPSFKESSRDVYLLVIISALLCLGALMVFSAGANIDQQLDLKRFWQHTTLRRVAFVPVVWLILAVVSRFDYHYLVSRRHFWLSPLVFLIAVSLALLVVVLISGLGTAVHSSRRWLVLGSGEYGLRFQPSELAKWTTVMFLAAYAAWRGDDLRRFCRGFVPACIILILVVGLIGVEDFGTAALVGAMGVMVLLIGGVRWWHLLILVPLAALAFYILVYSVDYRWQRVLAYWNNQAGSDSAYQAHQSIMAIGAGGIWGVGLGLGTIKLGWLPEDTTDFVFAVIGEELGFVGCALVIALFIALLLCSVRVIQCAPDKLGKLLAVAVAGTIGAQALMNLLVVTGLAPTKGIALPFVSSGGSGLVVTALASAVLINIARQTPHPV